MCGSGNSTWSTGCLSEGLALLRTKDKELRSITVLTEMPPVGTWKEHQYTWCTGGAGREVAEERTSLADKIQLHYIDMHCNLAGT